MKITKTKDGTFKFTDVTIEELRDMIMANCTASSFFAREAEWDDYSKRAQGRHRRFENALRIAESSVCSGAGSQYLPYGKSMTLDPYQWTDDDADAYNIGDPSHLRTAS